MNTTASKSGFGEELRSTLRGAVLVAIAVAAAIIFTPRVFSIEGFAFTPHAPDWSALGAAPPAVKAHLVAAAIAFGLGLFQLLGPKGTLSHRVMGWVWTVLLLVAAVSSLFIRQINDGAFSFIHILSFVTLVSLPLGIWAARRHNVNAHRTAMRNLFFGALVVAGVLAFLPGRTMWNIFLG